MERKHRNNGLVIPPRHRHKLTKPGQTASQPVKERSPVVANLEVAKVVGAARTGVSMTVELQVGLTCRGNALPWQRLLDKFSNGKESMGGFNLLRVSNTL